METEWFTDPNGFSGRHYLEVYVDRITKERTTYEVNSLLRLIESSERTTFLDMPCGQGRHCIELGKRGYTITGIDINEELLAIARRTAEAYRMDNITFLEGDMRTWSQKEAFDVALNLYVGFGYFKNDDDDDRVLENFHTSLKSRGTLVIDHLNRSKVAADHASGPKQTEWILSSGKSVTTESTLSDDQRYWLTTHSVNGQKRSFSLRLYTLEELTQKLKHAGFAITALYGDFDKTPLTATSPRVLLVARKL